MYYLYEYKTEPASFLHSESCYRLDTQVWIARALNFGERAVMWASLLCRRPWKLNRRHSLMEWMKPYVLHTALNKEGKTMIHKNNFVTLLALMY